MIFCICSFILNNNLEIKVLHEFLEKQNLSVPFIREFPPNCAWMITEIHMQETPAGLLHQNFDKTDKLSDIELRSPISGRQL